jgi:abhydrolase domain-containing protein 6
MSSLRIAVGRAQYRALTSIGKRLLGLRATEVTVDGVRIPVWVREGSGDPLVLVHGFGANKEGWLTLIGKLRGRAIIALDLPGFGGASPIGADRATAVHQARAVKGVLDHLNVSRATLVGSSMGGGIALRFAHDYPEQTRAVVLLGSVGPTVDKSQLLEALDRGENPLLPGTLGEYLAMINFVTHKKPWIPRSIAAYLADDQSARKSHLTALFAGWLAQDELEMAAALGDVKAPTLVIHGEKDRVIDLSTARAIASHVKNSTLLVLPGVGHVPQLEAPGEVARAIDAHLRAHA